MRAFVGHSFSDRSLPLAERIIKFIESLGIKCESGERAQNQSVALKVQERIDRNEMFVGIFTVEKICWEGIPWIGERTCLTSNWVIQESGYAIALKKRLLFIVEEGVSKFPQLQGDLEYILFQRGNLENLFSKLAQMITEIKSADLPQVVNAQTEEPPVQSAVPEQIEDDFKIKKLISLLYVTNNYAEAREYFERELDGSTDDPSKQAVLLGWVLSRCMELGDPTAFRALKQLATNHPTNPTTHFQYAKCLMTMGEYAEARGNLKLALNLVTIQSDPDLYLNIIYNSSLCTAKIEGPEHSYKDLLSLIGEHKSVHVFQYLAQLAKECNDDERFFVFSELALELSPNESAIRFGLAYAYSARGLSLLSMLHYQAHTRMEGVNGAFNNLGVEYDRLKLPGKSISAYKRAAQHSETLALANLAFKYIEVGFFDHAAEALATAESLQASGRELHGNVGLAKNALTTARQKEDKLDQIITEAAIRVRNFMIAYSHAFLADGPPSPEQMSGSWSTPWESLQFDIRGSSLTARTIRKLPAESSLTFDPPDDRSKLRILQFDADFEGCSARFDLQVTDSLKFAYVPNETITILKASGYAYFDTRSSTLHLLYFEKPDSPHFYEICKSGT